MGEEPKLPITKRKNAELIGGKNGRGRSGVREESPKRN